jgi:hypothetical protein
MTIRDARLEKCAACERTFDVNFPSRMQRYQKLHEAEQLHFWPCGFLEKHHHPRGGFAELYDTPWDEKPKVRYFHSEECEEAYTKSGSFDYAECEKCGRTVCEQNPANGWMWQFRNHPELGYIDLRCYQKAILEHGQPRSDFTGSQIRGGMFFCWNNTEAREAGFEEVSDYSDFFVQTKDAARDFNRKALELIDSGHKVIIAMERMAIGNLEGYITLMSKPVPRRKRGVSHARRPNQEKP